MLKNVILTFTREKVTRKNLYLQNRSLYVRQILYGDEWRFFFLLTMNKVDLFMFETWTMDWIMRIGVTKNNIYSEMTCILTKNNPTMFFSII